MLSGWGNYPRHDSRLLSAFSFEDVAAALTTTSGGLIARGNGRAYGDAAIGKGVTLSTLNLDHMRSFDPVTRQLTVEAGVTLGDIVETFLPRGYFPPVVPGTRHVTVGGMVAADVHGKNHHRQGGFGRHVEMLTVALPGGEVVACSRHQNPELFAATIGGMGLTGVILDATFTMQAVQTGWIVQSTTVASGIEQTLAVLEKANEATYSVAWLDAAAEGEAFGRSLVFAGNHATAIEVQSGQPSAPHFPTPRREALSIPCAWPFWPKRMATAAFNGLYYRQGAARTGAPFLEHWDRYFFPLDGVAHWNRLFGRRGLIQHQCVIPNEKAGDVLPEIFERFRRLDTKPVMAVLKTLSAGDGLLSFPLSGYTLAVDLPVTDELFPLLRDVDQIVVNAGGRLYLAKDSTQSRPTFEASYGNLGAFRQLRRAISAETRLVSRLSNRLGL